MEKQGNVAPMDGHTHTHTFGEKKIAQGMKKNWITIVNCFC